jgi:hypothetical protein
MKIVRQYISEEKFEKGLNYEREKGWHLDSWQAVFTGLRVIFIAVYSGRNS